MLASTSLWQCRQFVGDCLGHPLQLSYESSMLPTVENRVYRSGGPYVSSSAPLLSSPGGSTFTKSSYGLNGSSSSLLDSNGRFPEYLRRLCDIRQMDFEAAFDQMITLLSLEPQKV